MNCSPRRMRATLASSKMRPAPGSPSAAPVITTGPAAVFAAARCRHARAVRRASARSRARAQAGGVQAAQRLVEAAISPNFGWLVNSASTSLRSPSTSSTKPCSAFFGPDLDEHPRARLVQACAGP